MKMHSRNDPSTPHTHSPSAAVMSSNIKLTDSITHTPQHTSAAEAQAALQKRLTQTRALSLVITKYLLARISRHASLSCWIERQRSSVSAAIIVWNGWGVITPAPLSSAGVMNCYTVSSWTRATPRITCTRAIVLPGYNKISQYDKYSI